MQKIRLFLFMLLFVHAGLFAQNVSLDQAVQTSAQAIETRLPKGAKTAVLTFTSTSQAFSDYIIDEIATALSASRNIQVIDRQHTDAIRKEFKIQFSGDVSDAEVKRIGQQLGAQYVVTGSLVDIGNAYRFRMAAINIETAVREGSTSLNININDPQVTFLLTGQRAAQTSTPEGLLYEIVDRKTVTITQYIGNAATVNIPSHILDFPVTSIGDYAFFGCINLTSITVDNRNSSYSSIDDILFDKNKTTIIKYPEGKKEDAYSIPSSVTDICDFAFFKCINLASINIPSSVTSIGDYAFHQCENLTSVTLSRRTKIGEGVFPASARIIYRD
ncbi:MAG: leucine-rich repeat protein [Treponema sp.]|nr:leucine-rich repeat protein [Treponema sp.]